MWEDVFSFFKANDVTGGLTRIVPQEYPFIPYRPLLEAHVNKMYWKGDPDVPGRFAKLPGQSTLVIGIQDWMMGRDYQQLRTFLERAGFEFDLVAEGGGLNRDRSQRIMRDCQFGRWDISGILHLPQ